MRCPPSKPPRSSRSLHLTAFLAVALPSLFALWSPRLESGPPADAAASTRVIAWNDLGMHCTDSRFAEFSLLPPFNTFVAQVMQNGQLVTDATGLSVTYEAVADPQGSINKSSVGKTDFWTWVNELYGASVPADTGLAGNSMPGAANVPQPMAFDADLDAWVATGVPVVPWDDQGDKNYYPMMRVSVRGSGGALLATTDVVLPVSDEMSCVACHGSGAPDDAKPQAGWVNDPDPERDFRLNVLRLHDEQHAFDAAYASALSTAGYNAAGLYVNVTVDGKPILCARCHASNALPGTGVAGVSALTAAIHAHHATVIDPVNGMTLDAVENRASCYRCHPGSETRCLRGAMGAAVANDGALEMQCQSCHGGMSDVGDASRVGWLDEPACQQCHTGNAVTNSGKIRFTSAFDANGNPRIAADATFATNPDTPAPGFSLYRFSTGHGGLQCEACHGSTHAIYPSIHANDNVQNEQFQGHKGTVAECSACHAQTPNTVTGGPHGMHPIGSSWVHDHGDAAEGEDHESDDAQAAGVGDCRVCHGKNLKGTVLSRALGDRTLSSEFGKLKLWRGFQVGCYACHNGPSSESKSGNKAAKVKDLLATTTDDTALPIKLKGSDADGDSLDYRIVSQPEHGTVGLSGKVATYYPEPGFAGDVTFTYAAWDGRIDSNLAEVRVTVEDSVCASSLSDVLLRFDAAGDAGSVDLSVPIDCAWDVSFDGAVTGFVSLTSAGSGVGSATISFQVAANGGASRAVGLVVAGKTLQIRQGGVDSADLVPEVLSAKAKCGPSVCKIKGTLRVRNDGAGKAGKSVARVYLSDDAVLDGGDLLLGDVSAPKVKASKAQEVSFKFKVPTSTPISGRRLLVVTDPDNDVTESDDANNQASSDVLP